MDFGPGSASFALVAWSLKERHGRWSFWRRGTGEKHLYHHCRGNDDTCPVDYLYEFGEKWECRDCKAHPSVAIRQKYLAWKHSKRMKAKS